MRIIRFTIVLACMIAVARVSPAAPAEQQQAEASSTVKSIELTPSDPAYEFAHTQFVEFPRRYRELAATEVLKATRNKKRVDVRFKDTVRSQVSSESTLEHRIGFQTYVIGTQFETSSGITVAVPHLYYTPWMDKHVARAKALRPGQEVVVEGIVEGEIGGRHTVFADRIITPEEQASHVYYELICFWPGAANGPRSTIVQPGHHRVDIPGTSDKLSIHVESLPIARCRARIKAMRFDQRSPDPEEKAYTRISPKEIGEARDGLDVRLVDRIKTITPVEGDAVSITTSSGAALPIDVQIVTERGVRCLILRTDATSLERASRTQPGDRVEFRGTVSASGGERVLLVDDFTQADVDGPIESYPGWVVTLSRSPDEPKYVFASPGVYQRDVTVREGKTELLVMSMRQFRALHPPEPSPIDSLIGRIDRRRFNAAHGGTVFVQHCLPDLGTEGLAPNKFTYPPLWATLEPGMALERHHHPFPEFYVFTNGRGTMLLGDESFDVAKDMAVFIPSDEWHSVVNPETATEPMTWLSIGLKPKP